MPRKPAKTRGVYEKNPGSGIWYVLYWVTGDDGQPHRIRKKIGPRQQAVDYLNRLNLVRVTGEGVIPLSAEGSVKTVGELNVRRKPGAVTVGDLCDLYLAHIQDPDNPERPRDQVNPPTRVEAIRKSFGDRSPESIEAHEIEHWLVKTIRRAPATLNRYKSTFSAIYKFAKGRKLVATNPVRETKHFKVKLPPPRYLKPEEERRLYDVLHRWIEECPDTHRFEKLALRCHPLEVDVAIGTGLRKQNQYDLEPDWLDFRNDMIHIPESKNGDAISIPMIKRVKSALSQLLEIQVEIRDLRRERTFQQSPVRMAPAGRIFLIRENRTWWDKALKEANIKKFRWHDLRHTTASLMAQAGVNLKAIQEALAHKSIATTSRYAHLNKAALMDAMSVLN